MIRRVVLPQALSEVPRRDFAVSRGANGAGHVFWRVLLAELPGARLNDQFMGLGYHVYVMTTPSPTSRRPSRCFTRTVLVLLLTFGLNFTAIIIRSRIRRRLSRMLANVHAAPGHHAARRPPGRQCSDSPIFKPLNINIRRGEILSIMSTSHTGRVSFLRCLNRINSQEPVRNKQQPRSRQPTITRDARCCGARSASISPCPDHCRCRSSSLAFRLEPAGLARRGPTRRGVSVRCITLERGRGPASAAANL